MDLFILCFIGAVLGGIPHVVLVFKYEDGILGMGDYHWIWEEFPYRWDQVVFAELCVLALATVLLFALGSMTSELTYHWAFGKSSSGVVVGFLVLSAFFSGILHWLGVVIFHDKTAYGQRQWIGPITRLTHSRMSRHLSCMRLK